MNIFIPFDDISTKIRYMRNILSIQDMLMTDEIRVLYLESDDQAFDQKISRLDGRHEKLRLSSSNSKEEILNRLEEGDYDALVSFFKSGEEADLDLLREVKMERGQDIPFIICCERKNADVAVEALNLGADRYVVSDEDLDELGEVLVNEYGEASDEGIDRLSDSEEPLKTRKKNFRAFLDSITDWVWEMNIDGVHTYSNSAVKDLLGYEIDEVIGACAWDLWPEEDKEKIDKEDFREDLKEGEGWENFTGKFQHKDGSVKLLESTAVPIYDEEDELKGFRGIDRDITERRRAEKREKFLHSLLRHDVKNKLQITKGYLRLMEDLDLPEEGMELLNKARRSLEEEEDLIDKIKELREVDRKDEIETVELDKYIKKGIEDVSSMLEKSEVDVKKGDLEEEVRGGDLLEELFTNLLENSLTHSNCENIEISKYGEGEDLVVVFEDDGKGIPDDKKEKILEKRYKREGSKGSGLGMYLVKRILETYDGDIEVKDSEMGGVRFDIYLNKVS